MVLPLKVSDQQVPHCSHVSSSSAIESLNSAFFQKRDTHLSTVPASNPLIAANVWEVWDLTLSLPSVLGDEAVSSVGAGYIIQRSGGVVIAGVVRYCESTFVSEQVSHGVDESKQERPTCNGLSGQGEARKPEGQG